MRFELTTSGFVILRSNSVELQSQVDFGFAILDFGLKFKNPKLHIKIYFGGRQRTRTSMRFLAAVFKTAAEPIWLAFRNVDLRFRIQDWIAESAISNPKSEISNPNFALRKASQIGLAAVLKTAALNTHRGSSPLPSAMRSWDFGFQIAD